MFIDLEALWIDHVAVTTESFDETVQHYLSLPNARVLRGPGWNSNQNVKYLFVSFGGDLCIEILGLPDNDESPIASHVALGGGAYHICYAVKNLDKSIEIAKENGARLVVTPSKDDAHDGRRVAFLMHPAHGLFELVEAGLSFDTNQDSTDGMKPRTVEKKTQNTSSIQDEKFVRQKVETAFRKIFQDELPSYSRDWNSATIKNWDSLAHMRLVMEVERNLDMSFSSNELHQLQSLDAFLAYLRQ